jgi:hypothetical protein
MEAWFEAIKEDDLSKIKNFFEDDWYKDVNLLSLTDSFESTSIMVACSNNMVDILKLFLNRPEINIKNSNGEHILNAKNVYDDTALIEACYYGFPDIVELLLNNPDVDVNVINGHEQNALIYASRFGYYNILKMLLKHPNIDITYEIAGGTIFFDEVEYLYTLRDYEMQKKIIENKRDDIILFLEKKGLVHPKIKEEYPDLFTANSWGLI